MNSDMEFELILAQIPDVASGAFGEWLIPLACLLVMLNAGFSFYKNHVREDPRPHQTYAKIGDFNELSKKVNGKADEADVAKCLEELRATRKERSVSVANLYKHIDSMSSEIRKEVGGDIRGLHNLNRDVLKAVSKLEGQIEGIRS